MVKGELGQLKRRYKVIPPVNGDLKILSRVGMKERTCVKGRMIICHVLSEHL